MDPIARDHVVAAFRRKAQATCNLLPLRHQAEWQLASEGWDLLNRNPIIGDHYADFLVPATAAAPGAMIVGNRLVNSIPCVIVRSAIAERPFGACHVLADLAAYKAGKSFWSAAWALGFAILPDAVVEIVGFEYDTSEPEFQYLTEFLLSERHLNMPYALYNNDKAHGRMRIKLRTGAEFIVRSWARKEVLKGKTVTAYCYAEAYQLPGLEVYTTVSQNLREQHGFALFPTTPDRPWVGVLHDYGHGHDPDWHCTCCVDARENPFTYDQKARDRDDPALGGIMTRERYAIAWGGKLGSFVGRVYDFSRGDPKQYFYPDTFPMLWTGSQQQEVSL